MLGYSEKMGGKAGHGVYLLFNWYICKTLKGERRLINGLHLLIFFVRQ